MKLEFTQTAQQGHTAALKGEVNPLLQDIFILTNRIKEKEEEIRADKDRLGAFMEQLEALSPEEREDDIYETVEVKGKAVRVIDIKLFKKLYPEEYENVITTLRKEVEVKIPVGRCEAFIGKKKFAEVTTIPDPKITLKVVERGTY